MDIKLRIRLTGIGLSLAAGVVPLVAYSQIYLTEEQAHQLMFPGDKFTRHMIALSDEEIKLIEKKSDERVRNRQLIVWVSAAKNAILVDQVLGKHEFITLAVGIEKSKTVKDIEILEYRETYGYQVREEKWRQQFVGKSSTAPLKVGQDIINISGATLSSTHVTAGVRRLVQTYEIVQGRL